MSPEPPIDILIVDDSAVVRTTLKELLASAEGIGTVETAADPYIAVEKMRKCAPDVVVLDIEMPRMDGLTFLKKLMAQHPLPVVMCSAHVGAGSEHAVEALACGAVELIAKPRVDTRGFLEESRERVLSAVKAAARAHVERRGASHILVPKRGADAVIARPPAAAFGQRLVAIGSSTGGVEALHAILEALPERVPPIAIAQHMPEHFTGALADRLDRVCTLTVREAHDGDALVPGLCLVAPGGRHLVIRSGKDGLRAGVVEGEPVNRHKPSVDVLFRSAAAIGPGALAVLLTGMGDDGAAGMLEMREAGAATVAQDEESSVVWGMPGVAVERGAAAEVLALADIPERIVDFASAGRKPST